MSKPSRTRSCWHLYRCSWFAGLAVAIVLAACSGGEPSPKVDGFDSVQYTVKGVVMDASGLGADPRRLRIHHEAIDTLVGADGSLDPMRAMAMSLTVMPAATLPDPLEPGQKVEFVLDVAWERSPVAMISSVQLIDPATELALE